MILRVLQEQWAPFVVRLCARQDVETAGIILAERLRASEVLLGRHFELVPDDGYQIRRIDQLRIDPVAINRLTRRARDVGLSVITVHTHPGTDEPWFSTADDRGDSRLMPSLYSQMEGPHGSIVIAGNTRKPAGRVFSDSGTSADVSVRVIGSRIDVMRVGAQGALSARWFDRQRLALGEYGQEILRDLHVGIVGAGGTGSVCFVQLTHLGVGKITLIDGELVEDSNVSRIIGATSSDVGATYKVDVGARYAKALGLGTCVSPVRGELGRNVSTDSLETCDIVLSCVDRHTPRAVMNRFAYEKLVPVIDMGSAFRADDPGKIVAGAGRVVLIGPGRPCLACWGHIDPSRLRIEALSADDRARQAADGYIEGGDVPQPSVIAFNTMIAGSAVIELLRLVTGFAGVDDPPMRLSFDFESGAVRRNRLSDSGRCSICS